MNDIFQSASIKMEVFVLEKGHIMQELRTTLHLASIVNFEADLSVCIENVL